MITDPIADMLTRIRNAHLANHKQVTIPGSKMKVEIARILKEEGFILDYTVTSQHPQDSVRLQLKYDDERRPIISGLERVSKPGRRIYASRSDIPWVRSGLGIAILSTPKGVMTGRDARRSGVGGEVLCRIW